MEKELLKQILDNVPEDEPRSRLEPYREWILKWRRQGRSYRRICQLLTDKCGIQVTKTPLHEFVKRRSRPRKGQPELEPVTTAPPPEQTPVRTYSKLSPEEAAAAREKASSRNFKPLFPPEEPAKPLFVYDPNRPLTNKPASKEK